MAGVVIKPMSMAFCTIVARNYLPQARVLAGSLGLCHPGCKLWVLVLDGATSLQAGSSWYTARNGDDGSAPTGEPFGTGEPFETLSPYDIGLDPSEFHRMAAIYEVLELATAIKPWLLQHLLERGYHSAVYMDPDIEVFAPLEGLEELSLHHACVLTPHVLMPYPRDGRTPQDSHVLAAGVYNLGFLAVSRHSAPFLASWERLLKRDCIVDPAAMLFVDQRWVDFAPGLYDCAIWKDPAANVAYWNLHERGLVRAGGSYRLKSGELLKFFHFSGYDPALPWRLSRHQGSLPREALLLSRQPALAQLCNEYASKLLKAGYGAVPGQGGYGWAVLDNGFRLDRRARRLYRKELIQAEEDAKELPPNPFEASEAFMDWLRAPPSKTLVPSTIGRYLREVIEHRYDLVAHFGDHRSPEFERPFAEWLVDHGQFEESIDPRLLPDPEAVPGSVWPSAEELAHGVTLVGHLSAELGMGEAGRLTEHALLAGGVPYATLEFAAGESRNDHPYEVHRQSIGPGGYDVNLICINADNIGYFAACAGPGFFQGRYNIGVWAWELEVFPQEMRAGLEWVDEVWAISSFASEAISAATQKPVLSMPLPVVPPAPSAEIDRSALGIPDRFCFLYAFDMLSVFERKNPLGAIAGFRKAFAPGEGPVLVLKVLNGNKRLYDMERLRRAASVHPDVIVIDRYMSVQEKNALMLTCDCYVSLHRSEGFGLTMAEAMALGKPVIATAYSGNLEFMNEHNSFLVPYQLVAVGPGSEPYPASARWAEPDLSAAADLMRLVYDHPDEAVLRGVRARQDIVFSHSPGARSMAVRSRLDEISRARSKDSTVQPQAIHAQAREHHGPKSSATVRPGSPLQDGPWPRGRWRRW